MKFLYAGDCSVSTQGSMYMYKKGRGTPRTMDDGGDEWLIKTTDSTKKDPVPGTRSGQERARPPKQRKHTQKNTVRRWNTDGLVVALVG